MDTPSIVYILVVLTELIQVCDEWEYASLVCWWKKMSKYFGCVLTLYGLVLAIKIRVAYVHSFLALITLYKGDANFKG